MGIDRALPVGERAQSSPSSAAAHQRRQRRNRPPLPALPKVEDAVAAMLPGARNPIPVPISYDPQVRIRQSISFWQRNPGWVRTSSLMDSVLGTLESVGLGNLAKNLRPTPTGYGQPMVDQMQWQINSNRQPENAWWMVMNARLVAGGLVAEAYLRAGRAREIAHDPQFSSWLTYITLSDMVRTSMGLEAGGGYSRPGAIDPDGRPGTRDALSEAWRGASLLKRLEVALVLKPAARQAYWTAHDESIQAGKRESDALLQQVARAWPEEAKFGSAWAHTITLFRILNPTAAGQVAMLVQPKLLPQDQPLDTVKTTRLQRAFVKIITWADGKYEAPADAGSMPPAQQPSTTPPQQQTAATAGRRRSKTR